MSAWYPSMAEKILNDAGFDTDDHIFIFYAGAYDDTDVFISDLVSGDIVARSGVLAGQTITDGTYDCNNLTVVGVSGADFDSVLLAKWTGSDATSRVVCDLTISTFHPLGGDVNVIIDGLGVFTL